MIVLYGCLLTCQSEDQDTCSHRNRQLGLLIGAIIYGLPIHLAVVGRATATKHTPSFRMEFIKRFLAVLVWYWIGNMTYLYKGFTEGWYPSCTFAGPWSHQIWPIVRVRFAFAGVVLAEPGADSEHAVSRHQRVFVHLVFWNGNSMFPATNMGSKLLRRHWWPHRVGLSVCAG